MKLKKINIYICLSRFLPVFVPIGILSILFMNTPSSHVLSSLEPIAVISVDSLMKLEDDIIDARNKGLIKGKSIVFLTNDRTYMVEVGIRTLYNELGGKQGCFYYGGGIITGSFIFQAKFVSSCKEIEDYGRRVILKNNNEYPVNRSNVWKVKLLLKKCNAECMPNCCSQK